MVEATVRAEFYDLREHVLRRPGNVFQCAAERASEIEAKLPGYIEWEEAADGHDGDGLDSLTMPQLRDIARERGIPIPKGCTKARIIGLLRG